MADGFAGYDQWKCTEPAPTEPDAPDVHEQCDLTIERLEAEVAALHRRIEELEMERDSAAAEERELCAEIADDDNSSTGRDIAERIRRRGKP